MEWISCAPIPVTFTDFLLSSAPERIDTSLELTLKSDAKTDISCWLARPFSARSESRTSMRLRHWLYPLGTDIVFAPAVTSTSMTAPSRTLLMASERPMLVYIVHPRNINHSMMYLLFRTAGYCGILRSFLPVREPVLCEREYVLPNESRRLHRLDAAALKRIRRSPAHP